MDIKALNNLQRPCYVLEEARLRANLSLISEIASKTDTEFILAFKAYALWKTFPIFKEYITSTTASSLNEARLAYEAFGSKALTYSPAYTDYEIDEISRYSSHLTFNSLTQYARFHERVKRENKDISLGLRLNPEYSEISTELYNPCAKGSRFGVLASCLSKELPSDIEGLHFHCHCESQAEEFSRTLNEIMKKFSHLFNQVKWVNFGGGHLVTRQGYNKDLLINTLKDFKKKFPHLKVIMEPGSAFAWQTGNLISHVVDIVENHQIKTAIVNVSFSCHMPDCLEMPYKPEILGAKILPSDASKEDITKKNAYRIGGNSCLAGDYMGTWVFKDELKIGDVIIFKDMLHYTTVKTNMFNGISHPMIAIEHLDGKIEILRDFDYNDYKTRMD
ncbi:MAG: carboxynorspermidine decarboxylase [Prevotella sp.]|nr:carboxynorspermidine decarboxylase [Prevotella sp.]